MAELLKENSDEFEDYEPEIVDLDGEPFEVIDVLEYEGDNYIALVAYVEDLDENDEEEETEFIILKETEENGESFLATIDDEELVEKIADIFIERFEKFLEEMQ